MSRVRPEPVRSDFPGKHKMECISSTSSFQPQRHFEPFFFVVVVVLSIITWIINEIKIL